MDEGGNGCLLKVIILLQEKAMMAMGTAMGATGVK